MRSRTLTTSHVLLLLLVVSPLLAQPDTTKNFYPLQVGNAWEYERLADPITYTVTYKIVRDTLMPSGKRYYVFDTGLLLRIDDSLNTYRYSYYVGESGEFLMDKLGAKVGESWVSYRGGCIGEAEMGLYGRQVIFDDTVETRTVVYRQAAERVIEFADAFGPIYRVIEPGTRDFLIGAIINGNHYGSLVVSVMETKEQVASDFIVRQTFPNPFNNSVAIEYDLPEAGEVQVEVYNILGMKIKTIALLQQQDAGRHSMRWNGSSDVGNSVGSGVYFIRIRWNRHVKILRSVYLK